MAFLLDQASLLMHGSHDRASWHVLACCPAGHSKKLYARNGSVLAMPPRTRLDRWASPHSSMPKGGTRCTRHYHTADRISVSNGRRLVAPPPCCNPRLPNQASLQTFA